MDTKWIDQILQDTAYVHTGGTAEELKCAEYLVAQCAKLGLEAHIEEFDVDMADMKKAVLLVDGEEIPFTLENGQLIFSTDAAGLFLLVPVK